MSEVFARLNFNDGEILEARQDNTRLYTHIGRYALFDHIFVVADSERGAYLWCHVEGYNELAVLAVENECELHLNLQEVAKGDREVYERHALADLESRPDWLPE